MSQEPLPLDLPYAPIGPTLVPGTWVRFRPSRATSTRRLRDGKFLGYERDGSLTVADADGRRRCLDREQVYVTVLGRRGGRTWRQLAVVPQP